MCLESAWSARNCTGIALLLPARSAQNATQQASDTLLKHSDTLTLQTTTLISDDTSTSILDQWRSGTACACIVCVCVSNRRVAGSRLLGGGPRDRRRAPGHTTFRALRGVRGVHVRLVHSCLDVLFICAMQTTDRAESQKNSKSRMTDPEV